MSRHAVNCQFTSPKAQVFGAPSIRTPRNPCFKTFLKPLPSSASTAAKIPDPEDSTRTCTDPPPHPRSATAQLRTATEAPSHVISPNFAHYWLFMRSFAAPWPSNRFCLVRRQSTTRFLLVPMSACGGGARVRGRRIWGVLKFGTRWSCSDLGSSRSQRSAERVTEMSILM